MHAPFNMATLIITYVLLLHLQTTVHHVSWIPFINNHNEEATVKQAGSGGGGGIRKSHASAGRRPVVSDGSDARTLTPVIRVRNPKGAFTLRGTQSEGTFEAI